MHTHTYLYLYLYVYICIYTYTYLYDYIYDFFRSLWCYIISRIISYNFFFFLCLGTRGARYTKYNRCMYYVTRILRN